MLSIKFTETGKESLHELHISIQKEIKTELKKLATGKIKGKELTAQLSGFFTLHVSNHRVIYSQNTHQIIVHYAGHRSNVYSKIKITE